MKCLALTFLLGGCIIQPLPEKYPSECPTPTPVIATPKPVWPDTCVADWYASAKLPPCVEDYLQNVKTQQKKIATKKVNG
jgi:hypothetical protein